VAVVISLKLVYTPVDDNVTAPLCSKQASKQALYCVLIARTQGPGALKDPRPKNKRQFSNPWRPKCSEGSCSWHEKRSGRWLALNETASMFDNFVWLPRACVPGGVRSKKRSEFLFSYLIARVSAPAPRVFTLKDSGSSSWFPCQRLVLELIPSGSRPNN